MNVGKEIAGSFGYIGGVSAPGSTVAAGHAGLSITALEGGVAALGPSSAVAAGHAGLSITSLEGGVAALGSVAAGHMGLPITSLCVCGLAIASRLGTPAGT